MVVVAHPDDEIIWMGGKILRHPEWEWTILSLCRESDPDRAPKFHRVCREIGATGIIRDLDDEGGEVTNEEIRLMIEEAIGDDEFDLFFTHNRNGEYGHPRHVQIHKVMRKLAREGRFGNAEVWYFAYVPGEAIAPHAADLAIPVADERADEVLELSDDEWRKKVALVRDVYGFREGVFETMACGKREGFTSKLARWKGKWFRRG